MLVIMNENYFSKNAALFVANDYQWLIGKTFLEPYSGCKIDRIEIEEISESKYQIHLVVDAFG